jgi:hypothetical protein
MKLDIRDLDAHKLTRGGLAPLFVLAEAHFGDTPSLLDNALTNATMEEGCEGIPNINEHVVLWALNYCDTLYGVTSAALATLLALPAGDLSQTTERERLEAEAIGLNVALEAVNAKVRELDEAERRGA